jgi:hypothetical protein
MMIHLGDASGDGLAQKFSPIPIINKPFACLAVVSPWRFVSFASTTPSLATGQTVTFLVFGLWSLFRFG